MTGGEFLAALSNVKLPSGSGGWNRWELNSKYVADALMAHGRPEHFLQEASVIATMFVGAGASFTPHELGYLSERYAEPDLQQLLKEGGFGAPEVLDPPWGFTSGNLVHQLYHLTKWSEATGVFLSNLSSIVEIGGGYGACCLMAYRLGFKGCYTLIDLPVQSLLQEYYLSNTPGEHRDRYVASTTWVKPVHPDLLVGISSLSEMNERDRDSAVGWVGARGYLFHYMHIYDGVDNAKWFLEFAESRPSIRWVLAPNDLIDGSYYLFGGPNDA